MMEPKHLSRKFILAMATLIAALIALGFRWIEGTLFGSVLIANITVYNTANVMQKKGETNVPSS